MERPVPEYITAALHMNTDDYLRSQLKRYPGIVIIDVPYHLHDDRPGIH